MIDHKPKSIPLKQIRSTGIQISFSTNWLVILSRAPCEWVHNDNLIAGQRADSDPYQPKWVWKREREREFGGMPKSPHICSRIFINFRHLSPKWVEKSSLGGNKFVRFFLWLLAVFPYFGNVSLEYGDFCVCVHRRVHAADGRIDFRAV